jgi:hypothetical protein
MIMNTKFLTPSLHLPITTTTVATNIVSLDIVFFHTARTYALSNGILVSQKVHAVITVSASAPVEVTNNTAQANGIY